MGEIQYTLRRVPRRLDALLRAAAAESGESLNQVMLEALSRALGLKERVPANTDLDAFSGTWIEDEKFDKTVAAFREIDPEMWR